MTVQRDWAFGLMLSADLFICVPPHQKNGAFSAQIAALGGRARRRSTSRSAANEEAIR
jgi:hypothetical protein